METHPQLAKGFAKGDRIEIEKLWQNLAEELNSSGPPIKKPDAWKKAWSDKKSQIKKKLATNKKESRATGGGPHNQIYISSTDETIGKLCGLYDIVDGIEESVSYGFELAEGSKEQSSDSSDLSDTEGEQIVELTEPNTSSQPRKRKIVTHSLQDNLKKFMSDETTCYAEISKSLLKIQSTLEENTVILKNLESNTKRVYRALEKRSDSFKEQTEAIKEQTEEIAKQRVEKERHHKELEKLSKEKNVLKIKLLELQKEQLEVYKM